MKPPFGSNELPPLPVVAAPQRMNPRKPTPLWLLTLAAVALWVAGCASPNVNPPHARANTGYVDFRAEPADEYCWEVLRFDDRKQTFRNYYSELDIPPDGVLRLAFAPGHHRLRVTFLNQVVVEPAIVEVEVADGKVTPVRLTMRNAGTGLVETRELSHGGTAKGRYGRRVQIGNKESKLYRLTAVAEASVAYQPRAQTPNAR